MFLLYVRLLHRDNQSSSPQKKSNCSAQKSHLSNQKSLAEQAHRSTLKHLRHVESNHALERRLFH